LTPYPTAGGQNGTADFFRTCDNRVCSRTACVARIKEKETVPAVAEQLSPVSWLAQNGPKELEQLFRAVVYHPSAPILVADNDRQYRDASAGASRLLGLSREKLVGRKLDEFVDPALKSQIADLWQAFLHRGEQEGTLRLVDPDGSPREVAYTVKGNVLPVRHLVLLRDKSGKSPGQAETIPV
jgi:PAS domain S-box-containing protein